MTCKEYGKGKAYYVAARTSAAQMLPLFQSMLADAGIPARQLPEGVEYHVRSGEEGVYEFYLNCTGEPAAVSEVNGFDLVSETEVRDTLHLPGCGAAVVRLQTK